ncbi:MFS transporter [Micromonospora chaiyaphumensis]|uniref:Predicted arabinose efflux permease, MFS family n=1 Tax=Micromonospora chaiyaphumensis TaxID=307119 RepID=A0A1C4VYC6_9ACTN|nr:MFS transporter [Micromonospora chaiyaphumensis]SCE88781.1 Predicted arabinose efflux permease, MFS family [Micromonospora chaiyaphumensis]
MTTTRTTLRELARIPGGGRYALSAAVEAATSGMLRPFIVIYAVQIGLSAPQAGMTLTVGMLAGLGAVPLAGGWIDRGARRAPAVAALLVRAVGSLLLALLPGVAGFAIGAVLIGVGTQIAPPTSSALVAALAGPAQRAAALATGRSLRNAGLGAGALLGTVLVASGPEVLRWLALATALGCAFGAAVIARVPLPQHDVPATAPAAPTREARGAGLRTVTLLALAGIPYAFHADILEIALPLLLVQGLHASLAWPSGIFVANTVMVIALQLVVVVRLAKWPHRTVLFWSGLFLAVSYLGFWLGGATGGDRGTVLVALAIVPYTLGEILYSGSSVPLVIESVPPHLVGRALARWQLSYGLARAVDPLIITGLQSLGAAALWLPLAAATLLGAATVRLGARYSRPHRSGGQSMSHAVAGGGWRSPADGPLTRSRRRIGSHSSR